jgi:hypothetical protein
MPELGTRSDFSWQQTLAWRMERHHLVERAAPSDLVRVVREICGLHAQLMSSAELSRWARIDGLERDAVHEALWRHRALVKLWAMRGTLHLLPAAELGVWLSALGTQTKYGNTGHPEMDVLADAVGRALEGRVLTREELALEVEQITGSEAVAEWVRFSWGSYLKAASFRGLICFAPVGARSTPGVTTQDAHLPRAGLDLSGDARERPDGRRLSARAPLTALSGHASSQSGSCDVLSARSFISVISSIASGRRALPW